MAETAGEVLREREWQDWRCVRALVTARVAWPERSIVSREATAKIGEQLQQTPTPSREPGKGKYSCYLLDEGRKVRACLTNTKVNCTDQEYDV